ncbi:MAG TPA: DNA-processing protein DprA [Desulfobacterales bacterium]|nr:DNA-processing protein DprA [Desulfobacterales bacterium]
MEKILPWFFLKSVPGIGNHTFKRLFDHFSSPDLVLKSSYNELLQVEGMTRRLATAIKKHKLPDRVRRELDNTIQRGYRIITMADLQYPPLLLQIPDPPPFLYVYGSLNTSAGCIAVVGSRNATSYGVSTTIRLCSDLASRKITVVSGMAIGIDTAAHEGALIGGGKTIAVLGSGFEKVYPAQNLKLFHKIAENGAVITEFPLNSEPEAHNFPLRNRVISGICLGTVIVEATKKSGSLITARLAAEQNREVFAVPGSIQSFKSTGTHTLIKQGAKLVEHAQDIIEELSPLIAANAGEDNADKNKITETVNPLSPDESVVFDALGPYPLHIDDLVRKISVDPGKLLSTLLRLELKGFVRQSPGKYFTVSPE